MILHDQKSVNNPFEEEILFLNIRNVKRKYIFLEEAWYYDVLCAERIYLFLIYVQNAYRLRVLRVV